MPAAAPATDTRKPAKPPPDKAPADKGKGGGKAPDKAAGDAAGKGGDQANPSAKAGATDKAADKPAAPAAQAGADKAGGSKAGGDKAGGDKAAGGKAAGAKPARDKAAAGAAGADKATSGQQRFDRMAVRAKLAVSEPGDAVEREADAMADKVMRMPEPASAGAKPPAAGAGAGQPQLQRKEDPAAKSGAGSSAAPAAKPAAPQAPTTAAAAPPAPATGAGPAVQRKETTSPASPSSQPAPDRPGTTQEVTERLGAGTALDPDTRSYFEKRMHADFSGVRIHTDATAAQMAQQLSARAFTYGHHVAFASGAYQPQSDEGKKLIAHELTHVMQQKDGVSRMIMRSGGGGATGGSGDFEVTHAELEVPPIKARHLGAYRALADAGNLKRKGAYDASTRGTKQVQLWTDGVKPDINKIPAAQRPSSGAGFDLHLNMAGGAAAKVIKAGSQDELERLLKIPTWNASGGDIQFQVDHMVEYQLGGADDLANMELLNQAHNGSVGSSFSHGIKRTVREEIDADPKKDVLKTYTGAKNAAGDPTAEGVMEAMTVVFKKVKGRARESGRKEGGSEFWSRAQIEALDHVLPLLGQTAGLDGDATRFALLSPTGNLLIAALPHGNGATKIPIGPNQSGGMAGFKMQNLTLVSGYNDLAVGANVGTLEGEFDFGPKVKMPKGKVSVAVSQAKSPGKHSGKVGTPTGDGLPNQVDFTPMSPLLLSDLTLGNGVFGKATLQPSHPALSGINIPATIQGGKLGIFYTLDATTLAGKLKIPGVKIDSAGVTFGYDGTDFSVGGGAEFTIQKFGTGYLNAEANTAGDFSLEGGLHADKRLFDQADMKLWYRKKGGFGGSGTLGITTPGKIKGLKSAHLTAKYEDSVFSATGTVEPDIPGLKSASLGVTYGNDELQITGQLAIDDKVPGVEKADVTVTVKQANESWKVAASGSVTPKLPGLDGALLKFSYDDGFVLLEGGFDFKKGPLSGKVTAGVTNASVDDKGVRGSTGSGTDFKVFGTAEIDAVFIKDKLFGKLKLRLLPDGNVRVGGGLKTGDFEVFPKYPSDGGEFFNKTFETPQVPIPGLGFSVGPVSVGVTLSASLTTKAHAAIGPGKLTGIHVDITEFDPATVSFDNLEIGGGGKFQVMADAGFSLSAKLNLNLSAVVAELTGSVGAEASVGIPADKPVLEAETNFTYSQAKGLDITSTLKLDISPELKFRLFGEVAAKLNLLVDTITVWSKDWTLAEANYKLPIGIKASGSLNYNTKTGKLTPANPADAISVEKPNLDSDAMLGLVKGDAAPPKVKTTDPAGKEVTDAEAKAAPPSGDAPVAAQREDPTDKTPQAVDETIVDRLGTGQPLDLATRGFFEQRLHADLSGVQLHTSREAAKEAERIGARAFTVGEHIAFAPNAYAPDTPQGRELLAHELAHVVQQQGGAPKQAARLPAGPGSVTPASGGGATPAPTAAATETPAQRTARTQRELQQFVVPVTKRRHGGIYAQWQAAGKLKHGPNYDREADPPSQVSKWENRLAGFETRPVWSGHFTRLGLSPTASGNQPMTFSGGHVENKPFSEWVEFFKRPQWNHGGTWLPHRLEVDHIVELQAAGWPGARDGDEPENYELLDKSTNASAGGTIYVGMRQKMRAVIAAERGIAVDQVPSRPGSSGAAGVPDAETELKNRGVVFNAVQGGAVGDGRGGGRRGDANSEFWALSELQAGEHLSAIHSPPAGSGGSGTAQRFLLLSAATGGMEVARLDTSGGREVSISGPTSTRLASMRLNTARFNDGYGTATPDSTIGSLHGQWRLPPGITPVGPDPVFSVKKAREGQYNGYAEAPSSLSMSATGLSPIEFNNVGLDGAGLNASGRLMPSVPLFANQPIDVTWTHDDIRFARTFTADNLNLRVPGISLDAASVSVFYNRDGFGAEGAIHFTLAHLGTGSLTAGVDGAGRFSAEGRLDLDTRTFDQANLSVWYRDGAFGGSGHLAITQPGRIRGVNAASIDVTADAQQISATGNVQPAIPGVQNAALTASYGAERGLVVAGDLQLANIAGIREGSVHAEVQKQEGQWHLSANGRAVPALPGINSEILVSYADGLFDGSLSVDYARGIFSGNVTVGVTNRAVNPDGEVTAPAPADGTGGAAGGATGAGAGALSIYGSGTVTARLTDWLQGSIGVRVRPAGDLRISGSIGIPAPVTVFDAYPPPDRATRTLFSMPTISVPLVGLSVGSTVVGVALTINGRVTGHAQVGPGRLTQTVLRVEDFNPAQPESLHITGDAEFNVGAEAGVSASLDAGVSLGAAIINATAGINVSASAVLAAEARPHVHLDWRAGTGLALHADLDASLTPRLAFDVNGFAEVTANAFVTTFSLWRKDWNLAHRELGSNLALRIHAPVDYFSDGRGVVFDPEQVRFDVPSLNGDTLRQLLNDEGGREHVERDGARGG